MNAGSLRVGCSGWSYDDWRGVVYPQGLPARRWFACYARLFDTVELNSTFYRLPSASTVEGWATQAPPGFLFAVKLGQFGSHRKKLKDPGPWLARHVERFTPLGPTLGPNLVQLPPNWKVDVARLDEFLAAAPSTWRWAVELRHASWLIDDVFETLRRHRAALCVHDLLEDHPWERTTDWAYVRFHGPQARTRAYVGRYGGRRLAAPASRIAAWLDEGADVHAYFNNDVDGAAVGDAVWLRRHLSTA